MRRKESSSVMRRFFRLSLLGALSFGLAFSLSACARPAKRVGKQTTYEKIPFSTILASPDRYKGKVVKLGGVIIATENREEETILEVLQKPLDWQGRPKAGDTSGGRFMVVFDGFLDEAIYRPDRPITIVGEVIGTKRAPIGETMYIYPLLAGKEARLWQEKGRSSSPRFHIGIGIGGSGGSVGGSIGVGTSF